MQTLQELGETVASRRKLSGLKQGDVAAKAGVTPESLSRFERGKAAEFGSPKLLAVLALLGTELDVVAQVQAGNLDELRREVATLEQSGDFKSVVGITNEPARGLFAAGAAGAAGAAWAAHRRKPCGLAVGHRPQHGGAPTSCRTRRSAQRTRHQRRIGRGAKVFGRTNLFSLYVGVALKSQRHPHGQNRSV